MTAHPYQTLDGFLDAPTHKDRSHPLYSSFFFALRTMPESAYGEMLIGSIQRRLGLAVASEGEVGKFGTQFGRQLKTLQRSPSGAILAPRQWESTALTLLNYPRTSSQSKQRSLTLLPLVPELANYTSAVRLRGSPWNPGNLLEEAMVLGSQNRTEFDLLWHSLKGALEVGAEDDVWARFVASEVAAWRTTAVRAKTGREGGVRSPRCADEPEGWDFLGSNQRLRPPARRFVRDLQHLIRLKVRLTRREWIAYLESLIRLAAVTHSQWLCRVHGAAWELVDSALRGELDVETAPERFIQAASRPLWSIEDLYSRQVTGLAREYLRGRLGINLVMYMMEMSVSDISARSAIDPVDRVVEFAFAVQRWSTRERAASVFSKHSELLEADPKLAACRKGFTNNLREFWLYALSQRQTADAREREFDQGYWSRKRGAYKSAPWVVRPGPAALALAVHCCSAGSPVGRTVKDLAHHLQDYGVAVQQSDFVSGALAETMRGLGILVDSPDAESGMGLIDLLGVAQ